MNDSLISSGLGSEIDNAQIKARLHPWGVVTSFLFEQKSDLVTKIIDRTGLQVDWQLTQEQSATHKQRNIEYRPRIQNAYDMLSDEDRLRVSWIIANELASIDENLKERINSALNNAGWKMDSNSLTTDNSDIVEMFFPKGTPYDAYIEIKRILQQSSAEVIIIDPYIDGSIFSMLSSVSAHKLNINLLSYKLPSDFILEARKFLSQHTQFTVEIRRTKEFHDRFIILDNLQYYHLGASIKDAGNKAFMISRVEDQNNIDALIKQQVQTWNAATPVSL